jgi:two-component system chemotaxis sensor kinase CheA
MVWLDRLLGLQNATEHHGFYMAVLEAEGCRYGLVVDDLLAPEEIVVKPLSAVLRDIGLFSGATVLGNGTLALILDIAATAARAGVKPVIEEDEEQIEDLKEKDQESFLVFEDKARERTALPLGLVERIESVPLSQVEYANGRALLQYRGELLPLRDDGHVIDEMYADDSLADTAAATILICGEAGAKNGQRLGVVVRRVLDVSDGSLVEGDGAVESAELALVKDRLTTVFRGLDDKRNWKEVA